MCRGVTAELVRDQAAPGAALAFQQRSEESSGGVSIASRLHEDGNHVAVLVHGAPEILSPALNGDEELVLGLARGRLTWRRRVR